MYTIQGTRFSILLISNYCYTVGYSVAIFGGVPTFINNDYHWSMGWKMKNITVFEERVTVQCKMVLK